VSPRLVASLSLAPETRVAVTGTTEAEAEARPDAFEPAPALPSGPVDGDGDGITDSEDACPDQLGDASSDPARNGCPELRRAAAVTDGDGDGVPDDEDACPHDPGVTSGDSAGKGCPAPVVMAQSATPAAGGTEGATVTYSGFQVFPDGSSRLSVYLTGAPRVETSHSGKRAEFILRGVTIPVRNNKNPLLTSHFSSVVRSIRFAADGAPKKGRGKKPPATDTHLIVELRESIQPAHRMTKTADGAPLLVVDFPKPTSPVPPEPDPAPPPPVRPAE
jgi:hypothetical protein